MASGYGKQFQKNKKTVRAVNENKYGSLTCEYCKKNSLQTHTPNTPDFATVDHFIPLHKGGTHALTNLKVSCYECNSKKANLHPSEFFSSVSFNRNTSFNDGQKAG